MALKRLINLLKTHALRLPFELIRVSGSYNWDKRRLLSRIPKPRLRSKEELQQQKELYLQYQSINVAKMPKKYQNVYHFIVKYRLLKHVITIQRFIRKRNRDKLKKINRG